MKNPFRWFVRAKPDPDAFLAELLNSIRGGGYSDKDRYADFRAVFQGQSTPEQGRRVLWEMQRLSRMYHPIKPDDTESIGKRNLMLEIFKIMNMEPSDKDDKPQNVTKPQM